MGAGQPIGKLGKIDYRRRSQLLERESIAAYGVDKTSLLDGILGEGQWT
ncbi:hypothetical protein GGD66_002296 [Bradyrhizobium sp. CIR48]|nr:hypothetical protein [Bradyrhizobium sp. CIR48]